MENLPGSLAWLATGVGYAWTVRKLARMARTAAPGEPDQLDSKVKIVVDEPAVPRAPRPSAAESGAETPELSASRRA